jgi:deoxycytidylate deaminase
MNSSSNLIRKVSAVVIQNGSIIGEGINTRGDDTCPKCSLFDQGKIDHARQTSCNHPHAEFLAIDSSIGNLHDAAIIITTAPCTECANYIHEKKIPLVVYLEDCIRVGNGKNDTSGIQMLENLGVCVRKAGI